MKIIDRKDWFEKELNRQNNDLDSLTYKYVLEFSENILDILNKKNIKNKNKYLAKKLKCSPAYISKLFNGRSNFTVHKLVELAKAVDYNLNISLRPNLVVVQAPTIYTASINVKGGLENFTSIRPNEKFNLTTVPISQELIQEPQAA